MRAVGGLAVRLLRRSALIVTAVVAGMSALVVVQYRQTFAGTADLGALAALSESPAIRTLFGPPVALGDPGGFTVWRTGTPLAVLTGIWALLAITRVTRGEEDAGRWALLLSGRIRLARLVAVHLTVLGAAALVVGAALTVAMIAAGTRPGGALLHGAGLAATGVWFAGLGALAGQLVAGRRGAAGLAASVLAVALLARMVADGVGALAWLAWLAWLSPFGLLGLVQPYAAELVRPLIVLAVMGAGLCLLAVAAAGARDLGAGWIAVREVRRARPWLVRSLPAFAIGRVLPGLAGWSAGIAAYILLIGLLASSMSAFLRDNPRFAELAASAGIAELGSVEGYAAALFGVLAIALGFFAAGQFAADAGDETARRLTLLFARPVARTRWAALEAGVVTLGCTLLVVVAGLAMWAGAGIAGAGLGLGAAVAGELNVLPVPLLCAGAALFALGWAPGVVLPIGALPAAGGFLLHSLAESFGWPGWVDVLSPFAHLAAVPARSPDWAGTIGMTAVAAVLAVAGAAGYTRRDLRG